MLNEELLDLARRLRRRVEQTHRSCWTTGPLPSGERSTAGACGDGGPMPDRLSDIARRIEACRICPLAASRTKTVPGVGSPDAKVLFIGEGPGFEEDRRGEPFVGPAGELLDRILAAIGLSRQTVYIANIVRCHPMKDPGRPDARGNDRPPSPEEMAACRPYLDEQIRAIRPRFIVALGAVAARALLKTEEPIGRLRGTWAEYRDGDLPVKLMPTYHPAALLRNPELKKDVWKDMKALRAALADA